jgi:hypothetical protein
MPPPGTFSSSRARAARTHTEASLGSGRGITSTVIERPPVQPPKPKRDRWRLIPVISTVAIVVSPATAAAKHTASTRA